MIGRLLDPWFEASFIGRIRDDGCAFSHLVDIDGAQGIFLWCPCGYGRPEFPLDGGRVHGLIVPFANPRNAPTCHPAFGPTMRDGSSRPRWMMSGSGLDDLTLSPSIDVGTVSCWHGYIIGGLVT